MYLHERVRVTQCERHTLVQECYVINIAQSHSLIFNDKIDTRSAPPASNPVQNQVAICPFALREVSGSLSRTLGHLRYHFKVAPPQSNCFLNVVQLKGLEQKPHLTVVLPSVD